MKVCCTCRESKPLEEFYHHITTADGKMSHCKMCHNTLTKKWYAQNRAKHQRSVAEWKERNRRRWKEYLKSWMFYNPSKVKEYIHRGNYKRRARLAKIEYDRTITLREVYRRDRGICYLCGLYTEVKQATIDHVVPISLGGPHVWNNVRLAHRVCNSRKGKKRHVSFDENSQNVRGDCDGRRTTWSSRTDNVTKETNHEN